MGPGHPVAPFARRHAQVCGPGAKDSGRQGTDADAAASLTDYGKFLRPITEVMCEWGQRHRRRIRVKK